MKYYYGNNQPVSVTKPSVANPGQQTVTTMAYDANGNLISRQNSSGTIRYAYNDYGQITAMDGPRSDTGDVVSFSYYPNDPAQGNNRGNLQTVTNAMGHTTAYSDYNALGQAETATDPNGIVTISYAISYGWDAATGELAGMTYPSGLYLAYARDAGGQVTSISLNGTPLISAVSHLPFGPLKSAALGSVSLTRDYDQRYNITRITAGGLDYSYEAM